MLFRSVRKISSGEGVERTFQLYSPLIANIEVKRRGDVRRAKLYYLRERTGKSRRLRDQRRGLKGLEAALAATDTVGAQVEGGAETAPKGEGKKKAKKD